MKKKIAITQSAFPRWMVAGITTLLIGGQVLVGSLLLGSGAATPLVLMPAVAGVVVTSELLAVVARLDMQLERDSGDGVPSGGLAAVIGGCVFGVVVLASAFPGPTGLVAVVLASGACVVLATLLVRDTRPRGRSPRAS